MGSERILNGAVVGLQHLHPRGYMASFGLCPNVRITAAFDPDAKLLAAFCADYGIKGYTDLHRLLAEEPLDFAVLFLPHAECVEPAIECARKGLHLMIEKPIADTVAATRRVTDAVAECGVKLTTGYAWRFHPVVRQMKALVEQGLIGRLVSVEARLAAGRVERYLAGHSAWMLQKARSGGGPMYNLGVHWLDLIAHVTGEKVAAVCAVNTHSSDAYDIEDSSLVLMKYASGAVGVLSTSYIVPDSYPCGRDLYIGLRGTEGMLCYAPQYEGEQAAGTGQTEVLELYSSVLEPSGAVARKQEFQLEPVPGYSGGMGKAYIEDFVQAVLEDREPAIGAAEALAVLKVVEAVYASAEQGKWIEVWR